jgi:hypothetical protein
VSSFVAHHVLMTTATFDITPDGPFSLRELALFGFGHRHETDFDGVMRLAFCVDGYGEQVGVEVRQDHTGVVRATVRACAATERKGAVTVPARPLRTRRTGPACHKLTVRLAWSG